MADAVIMTNYDKGMFDLSGLYKTGSTEQEKRQTLRGWFESHVEETSSLRKKVRYGHLEDIYKPKQYQQLRFDAAEEMPVYRQLRVDAHCRSEAWYEQLRKQGQEKVFRGSPAKSWQVLDESFDAENRSRAQAAVKDSSSVVVTVPHETSKALSQRRRSAMVVEVDGEKDPNISYVSVPFVSQHIK